MRTLIKRVGLTLALVALYNIIALAQYASGPSDLTRGLALGDSEVTNLISRNVRFPVSSTNVDLAVSAYNDSGADVISLTFVAQRSMDSLVWSNVHTFTATGNITAGSRVYLVTNVSVGNYGWFRISYVTNNSITLITNVQVTATHKGPQ